MKIHEAGISGLETSQVQADWDGLGLSSFWRNVVEILCPGSSARPIQIEAIRPARLMESRRNLLVSAPTNSGKTLVGLLVLLEAVHRGKRAVLLEPLRALAREKAEWLQSLSKALGKAFGHPFSVRITTGDYRLEQEAYASPPPTQGELIIATPERFEAILRNTDYDAWIDTIEAVCVDEAHLLASPRRGILLEYLLTSLLCRPAPPRLALLSATLGDTTRLAEWLSPCDTICTRERYPSLRKQVWELAADDKADEVVSQYVSEALATDTSSALVFVYQTRSAERLAASLEGSAKARAYHAQMSLAQRDATRKAFLSGECRCLVTTTALGLGVNLPATHVMVRDITFPGVGQLDVSELLQMMGRAGRGNRPGEAAVLVRPTDGWCAGDLALELRTESIGELRSPMERLLGDRKRDTEREHPLATCVAAYLARQSERGATAENIQTFFDRSLGGKNMAAHVPAALRWLSDPRRVLAYQNDDGSYLLTTLGQNATRSVLPLTLAAGFAQLVRDLLSVDPTDRLLGEWTALDHLIVLSLFAEQAPHLRPYSAALEEQVEAWMETHPELTPLLYREWIRGKGSASRAEEILGSLGIPSDKRSRNGSQAAKASAIQATFRAILLHERGQGKERCDVERQWGIRNLEGVEERWRDEMLWLLSGIVQLLDLKCFYYHLREECQANLERVHRVKQALNRLRAQTYDLRETLVYCSPLGAFLQSLRRSKTGAHAGVGVQSVRALEACGVRSPADLIRMTPGEVVACGIRPKAERQIREYLRRRLQ